MPVAERPTLPQRPALAARPEPGASAWPDRLENAQPPGSETHVEPAEKLAAAVNNLRFRRPELSSGCPVWAWQIWFFLLAATAAAVAATEIPEIAFPAALAVLSLSFASLAVLRLYALWNGRRGAVHRHAARFGTGQSDDQPSYTILVPLFREAGIAEDLMAALQALDYPASALQVIVILEEHDEPTRLAVGRIELPENFDIVVVPAGAPQTKPRALNYALHEARGDFVTVYDAEDVPEPEQLRLAAAAFAEGPPNLACVQARLNIYNTGASWLTRGIMALSPQEMNPLIA